MISNLNKNTYIIKLNSLKHKVDLEVEQMKYMWYAPLMVDPLSEPCQSAHIQWYLAPNNHLKLHVPYWNLMLKSIKNLVHIKVLDVRALKHTNFNTMCYVMIKKIGHHVVCSCTYHVYHGLSYKKKSITILTCNSLALNTKFVLVSLMLFELANV